MTRAAMPSLQIIDASESRERRSDYWRSQSAADRLRAALALHLEGNALFKRGNPAFVRQWTLSDVHAK